MKRTKSVKANRKALTRANPANPPKVGSKPNEKNDNIVTLAELAIQINAFHLKARASEEEALRNAWESGVRLNRAFREVKYGKWGKFLKENCADLGLTTVWRYRKLADGFSTVEELAGMTLSAAYSKLGLTKFEEESTSGGKQPAGDGGGVAMNTPTPIAKVIQDVVKASPKFDKPETLSQLEKSAVKKLCSKLEDVHGQINEPSILGVSWQAKIADAPEEWPEEDVHFFREEFEKLRAIYDQLQKIKEEK